MERKNSHQVNHNQKSLPSKTECLMKSVSGSFGIAVYNVHKHIRAKKTLMYGHSITRHGTAAVYVFRQRT